MRVEIAVTEAARFAGAQSVPDPVLNTSHVPAHLLMVLFVKFPVIKIKK